MISNLTFPTLGERRLFVYLNLSITHISFGSLSGYCILCDLFLCDFGLLVLFSKQLHHGFCDLLTLDSIEHLVLLKQLLYLV
jgi:hypothetical protein